jgi:hypothetical protein
VPPPDSTHAVGASLGRLRRPSLRAHREARVSTKHSPITATTGSLAALPYHPHIQHSHLSTTATYLQGISSEEIVSTVHARRAPMMHASAGLDL